MKKVIIWALRILKWVCILFIAVIVLLVIARFVGQQINSSTPEGGINEEMYVNINGTEQWISIYGQDIDNPVLSEGGIISDVAYQNYLAAIESSEESFKKYDSQESTVRDVIIKAIMG
ncbi:MAG: hypothetical protein IJB19_00145 [Clostridia bacterium]|nr:hypothetical protein [Clostridia bacterium]